MLRFLPLSLSAILQIHVLILFKKHYIMRFRGHAPFAETQNSYYYDIVMCFLISFRFLPFLPSIPCAPPPTQRVSNNLKYQ